MTTRRQMAEMIAMQARVIAALRGSGDERSVDRLVRCMEARLGRRSGDGRPWTCRSAGCSWCRKTTMRRWWTGIQRWIADGGEPVSIVILPLQHRLGELRAATAGLRRSMRDLRDRTARRRNRWRGVAVAGIASGDGTALLLIRHAAITRAEVADVMRRRWPGTFIGDAGSLSPSWQFGVEDAAELGRARRGVEPIRLIVLAQRAADVSAFQQAAGQEPRTLYEPMPIVF
jgi:hypothetical protein